MESLVQGMLSNAIAVTVLAVLVAVLGRACRRPALIHSLCLVAILKLVTPPLVPLAMPLPSSWWPSAAPVPLSVADEVSATERDFDLEMELEAAGLLAYLDDIDERRPLEEPAGDDRLEAAVLPAAWRWEPMVLGAMLAGALAWWSLALVRIVRFHRMLRDVEPMPAEWQARIGELAGWLTLRRPPVFCMVPGEVPPMLWAVGLRPRLLVPRQLWETLGEEQRGALVLHELAHLKRRDHWVRWIELVIAGLYWWHPAVWWLRRALREAEEQCCDAWVVWAMPRGARTYATALVAALEYVSGARKVPVAASVAASATIGNGHVSSLKRRLRMIVRAKTPKRLSLVGRFAVVGLAALLLPLAPSWAVKGAAGTPEVEQSRPARNANATLKASWKKELAELEKEIAAKKAELKSLAAKRHVESTHVTEDQYTQVTSTLLQNEMEMLETQADLDAALAQAKKARERSRSKEARAGLEARIKAEFQKDPDAISLNTQIKAATAELEKLKRITRRTDNPANIAVERKLRKLKEQWETLWNQEHDQIARKLASDGLSDSPEVWEKKIAEFQLKLDKLKRKRGSLVGHLEKLALEAKGQKNSDTFHATMLNQELASLAKLQGIISQKLAQVDVQEKARPKADDKAKDSSGRETAERIEKQLKELVDKLGKDVSPVGQEVRKALERSVDEIHKALQKDGMTADELRQALEKSREELRKSFDRDGPVQKEMREASERARKEMRETMERGRQEAERLREQMHKQMQEAREQQRKRVAEAHEQQKKASEARRKMAEETQQRERRSRADRDREQTKSREVSKVQPKPDTGDRSNRGELDAARKQIRELQQRLEEATRRLNMLERRDSRGGEPPARPAEPRRPERPAEPARPATPARPAEPRRPERPARPARPATPRDNLQPGRDRDDDRRFRELEEKMNQLLKELEELKGRKTSADRIKT